MLDYVLGIVKAYTTRVGSGPFPTELFDDTGKLLAERGNEFGSVTGRPRRCGWFDAPALRRSLQINGVTGLCITKLDVLDTLPEIKICTGYKLGDKTVEILPFGSDEVALCVPIYETLPGWQSNTFGVQQYQDLPENARRYLQRLQELVGVPVSIVSTGPDRVQTIIIQHPFA